MEILGSIAFIVLGLIILAFYNFMESKARVRFVGRAGCVPWAMIAVGIYYFFASIFTGIGSLFAPPTPTPWFSVDPKSVVLPTKEVPTRSVIKTKEPQESSCLRWEQVTLSQAGQEICVYGIVYALYPTNETATRIKFTSTKNTFFLSDGYGYYPDLRTGECVYAIETLLVYNNQIPYMDIDKLYECENSMK